MSGLGGAGGWGQKMPWRKGRMKPTTTTRHGFRQQQERDRRERERGARAPRVRSGRLAPECGGSVQASNARNRTVEQRPGFIHPIPASGIRPCGSHLGPVGRTQKKGLCCFSAGRAGKKKRVPARLTTVKQPPAEKRGVALRGVDPFEGANIHPWWPNQASGGSNASLLGAGTRGCDPMEVGMGGLGR